MIDLDYLNFLENILTENRKAKFLKVLENRTKHPDAQRQCGDAQLRGFWHPGIERD